MINDTVIKKKLIQIDSQTYTDFLFNMSSVLTMSKSVPKSLHINIYYMYDQSLAMNKIHNDLERE
jgi:hypothetical protein